MGGPSDTEGLQETLLCAWLWQGGPFCRSITGKQLEPRSGFWISKIFRGWTKLWSLLWRKPAAPRTSLRAKKSRAEVKSCRTCSSSGKGRPCKRISLMPKVGELHHLCTAI